MNIANIDVSLLNDDSVNNNLYKLFKDWIKEKN